MTLKKISAIAAVLSLAGCTSWSGLDQVRAKVLNNFQNTELRISPEITRQAKIENANVYSPGMALAVALDITAPKSCSSLIIDGSFLDKDGTKIASLTGAVQGYEKNQKAHMEVNSTKMAPLFRFDTTIAVATLDKLKCLQN
jgi:hypothetical protein